jgi:hypothetical protein
MTSKSSAIGKMFPIRTPAGAANIEQLLAKGGHPLVAGQLREVI